MKFEWRKHEKALYGAKRIPALVDIPKHSFIMMKGSGNPNNKDFSDRAGALFSLAYAIKMGYKSTAIKNISTCAVAIWLGAAIKQQKYNSHILPSAL